MVNRTKRFIALAVVGLFLGTSLAELVHNATTAHVRCAEHDELVHAPERAPKLPDNAINSTSASTDGSHKHCGLTVLNQERSASVASVATEPAAPVPAVLPPRADHDRPSVALYLSAPKTSPPA